MKGEQKTTTKKANAQRIYCANLFLMEVVYCGVDGA